MKSKVFLSRILLVGGFLLLISLGVLAFTDSNQDDNPEPSPIAFSPQPSPSQPPSVESSPEQPSPSSDQGTNSTAKPITITGKIVCLPHIDTSGPQTLECAFGLLSDAGDYYALRDTDPNYGNLTTSVGGKVEIKGNFTSQESDRYQSVGVIEVKSVTSY